ncbi:BPI fold-containing family A member 2 [Pipistrellus kuhlii]|uniref:BPI fold-containing family A member 2 n=1 Tax=Pipistrellus kuhlii TaxID=59472 RepID=UPI001E2736AF|nr:BPI fold-containing family A member 2 [Pipistrellus kuhlii]
MFQLWKFVLLCGLLTGTSANVVEKLTEAVKHGITFIQVEEPRGRCERSSRPLLTVNLIVCRPVIKQTVKLNASLDVMATLEIETDSKSGESRVVMTDCTSDPNSISMSFKGK